MSRKVDADWARALNQPPASPPEPAPDPKTLRARHRRTIVVLSIAAVALAMLTAGAIFLTISTQPAEPDPQLEGIVAGADAILEERKQQFIDVAIWIGWFVGGVLIGLWARSEFYKEPTGDHDAGAVQDRDPMDPD